MHDGKDELRNIKRALKKSGNKRRRAHFKRDLEENPDEAHKSEYRFTRDSSTPYNGMDSDATRRKKKEDDK